MALGLEKGEFGCVDIHIQHRQTRTYLHTYKCTKALFMFLRYVKTVVTLSHLCKGPGFGLTAEVCSCIEGGGGGGVKAPETFKVVFLRDTEYL